MDNLNIIYFYLVVITFLTAALPYVGHVLIRKNIGFILLANILVELGKYTALANTLVHEIFHCIFAWITGGKAHAISLHHDTSGLAVTSSKSRIARILVSYGGYTGSSLSAIGLFYCLNKGYYNFILYIFVGISIMGLLLWLKNFLSFLKSSVISILSFRFYKKNPNLFGLIWSTSFLFILVCILYKGSNSIVIHTSVFLSVVILIESIKTAFVIFVLSLQDNTNAGDATNLAKATYIPAAVWGLIFFVQAVCAGHFIVTHYFM